MTRARASKGQDGLDGRRLSRGWLALVLGLACTPFLQAGSPAGAVDFAALDKHGLRFQRHVFDGEVFPACDFANAALARKIVPDLEISTRFFDADFREVTRAERPGRYGALVRYGRSGDTRERGITLYRLADPAAQGLAAKIGISEALAAAPGWVVGDALGRRKAEHAVLLAVLHDIAVGAEPTARFAFPGTRDRQWWDGLRHRLGQDVLTGALPVCKVTTPAGYTENLDGTFGLLMLVGEAEVPVTSFLVTSVSVDGAAPSPEDILLTLDRVALRHRVDARKIVVVGRGSGAASVRVLALRYPERLAAAWFEAPAGGRWRAWDLSGTRGADAVYARRGRDAELADPPDPLSAAGLAYMAGISKPLRDDDITPNPLPAAVRVVAPPPPQEAVVPARFVQALREGRAQTIMALGTSLTSGGAWVGQLQAGLDQRFPGKAKLINGGASGRNGGHGLASVGRVIANRPDAVLIEYSMNDAKDNRMPVAAARSTLEATLDGILAGLPDCEIIPMTMNNCAGGAGERRPTLSLFYQSYRDAARERGLRCIDHHANWVTIWEADPDRYTRYIPDGCHPGGEGSADVIVPEMLRALGL